MYNSKMTATKFKGLPKIKNTCEVLYCQTLHSNSLEVNVNTFYFNLMLYKRVHFKSYKTCAQMNAIFLS